MSEQTIELDNWKGKGEFLVTEATSHYTVKEPRKDKETGVVDWIEHKVPKYNVDVLWLIIESRCDQTTVYGYKWLVRQVIEQHDILQKEGLSFDVMANAFNGGRYRALYYFPLLYYPLKILEKQGHIRYFGRGGIQRAD